MTEEEKLDHEIDFFTTDPRKRHRDLESEITDALRDKISVPIRKFLKLRKLKLSTEGFDELITLLALLYLSPYRPLAVPKKPITGDQKKKGITKAVTDELERLDDAFNISPASKQEIWATVALMADDNQPESEEARIYMQSSFVTAQQIVKRSLMRINKYGALEATIRNLQPEYIGGSIAAYQKTVRAENPTAGFSKAESADLYEFMVVVRALMEPEKSGSTAGLSGDIQKALNNMQKHPDIGGAHDIT